MKTWQLFFLIFLNTSYGFAQNVFTKVPTPPHNHEVEVYFLHELPIAEPYFKTLMVEAEGYDYNQAVVNLKQKAQKLGADGVIILNNEGGRLVGIGIKYKKNMMLLDSVVAYLKKIKIIPIDNRTSSGDILFEIDGTLKPAQNTILVDYFQHNIVAYDFDFLVKDKSLNWEESPDIYNRIGKRKYKNGIGNVSKKINFRYANNNNLPEELEVSDMNYNQETGVNSWHTEKIVPFYNPFGLLEELKVYWKNALVRRQQLFYDDKKRLIMADWTKFEQNKPIPYLRVEYEYYKNSDLER